MSAGSVLAPGFLSLPCPRPWARRPLLLLSPDGLDLFLRRGRRLPCIIADLILDSRGSRAHIDGREAIVVWPLPLGILSSIEPCV